VQSIHDNLIELRKGIADACAACGRKPEEITLVGVAKTKPAELVREAHEAGVRDIGENYLQEADAKIATLRNLPITWHYIGAIQSNKTRQIAELFDWVHTVDRRKIAERLSRQCPPGKTLNVLLQVNVDADPAKAGVLAADARGLLEEIAGLPNLAVRGLMTILSTRSDPGASYQSMAQLFADLRSVAVGPWDALSMGMSGDMHAAITAGATHVRIGTALFGARD
jgi:pyridoxal phosphate enzyme (YggS family)